MTIIRYNIQDISVLSGEDVPLYGYKTSSQDLKKREVSSWYRESGEEEDKEHKDGEESDDEWEDILEDDEVDCCDARGEVDTMKETVCSSEPFPDLDPRWGFEEEYDSDEWEDISEEDDDEDGQKNDARREADTRKEVVYSSAPSWRPVELDNTAREKDFIQDFPTVATKFIIDILNQISRIHSTISEPSSLWWANRLFLRDLLCTFILGIMLIDGTLYLMTCLLRLDDFLLSFNILGALVLYVLY